MPTPRPSTVRLLLLDADAVIQRMPDTWRDDALAHEINIAPGPMFSPTQGYQNCIRLSCGVPWTPRLEKAVQTLGRLAKKQAD